MTVTAKEFIHRILGHVLVTRLADVPRTCQSLGSPTEFPSFTERSNPSYVRRHFSGDTVTLPLGITSPSLRMDSTV